MRKTIKFLAAISLLFMYSLQVNGQNCNLINSATFTVPDDTNIIISGNLHRMAKDTIPLNLNKWNYVAMVIGTNQYQIFLNGKMEYEGDYSSSGMSWNELHLGAHEYSGLGSWFNGWIDELRISNTVLPASAISNYYASSIPFTNDASTIGLWHFDQTEGDQINSEKGVNGTALNATWDLSGKFGSCLYYNGANSMATMPMNIPVNNMTCEFWIKPHTMQSSMPVDWYGSNTSGFRIDLDTLITKYTWSTGETGTSVTINPQSNKYIWVSNGSCTDTVFFETQSAKIYDTILVSVTDTLVINAVLTGINPPNNANNINLYPNPAKDHLTIDYGNFTIMSGYSIKITNSLGQEVFSTAINQQKSYLNLSQWGGNGLYFVHLIDNMDNTIEIKKIILK